MIGEPINCAPDADRPVVYVCLTSVWTSGDVAGVSVNAEHGALFGHVSSGTGWLIRDTTNGFADRAAKLAELFPDGWRRVFVDLTREPMPEPIAKWFTKPEPTTKDGDGG